MVTVISPLTLQAALRLPSGLKLPRPKAPVAGFPPQAKVRWA